MQKFSLLIAHRSLEFSKRKVEKMEKRKKKVKGKKNKGNTFFHKIKKEKKGHWETIQ